MKSKSPIRSAFWIVIAVMAFFAMAASSPQCAQSTDYAVNPSFDTQAGGNPCIDECNAAMKVARAEEKIRFKAALSACNGDQACRDYENAIHDSNQAEITADDADCKAACQHEQGTATGGQ